MTDVNDFVKAVNTILRDLASNADYENKEKFLKYVWGSGQFLALPHSISDSYNEALSILKKKVIVTRREVSNQNLERMFEDFLFELYYDHNEDKRLSDKVHEKVGDLFRAIRHLEMFDYLVIVPLLNIKAETCLQIGSVQILGLTPEKVSEINKEYSINLMMGSNERTDDVVKKIQEDSRHPTAAIMTVESSDFRKAEELALQATDQALNVLRFYLPSFRGMIKGEELKEVKRTILIANITDRVQLSVPRKLCNSIDPLYPDEIIDQDIVLTLRSHKLEVIKRLLEKPITELSPLQRDILNTIYWIGNASKDAISTDKLIKYVIALDTLLSQDRRDKSDVIAKRFTAICNQNSTDDRVIEVYEKIKSYYALRNDTVHAGHRYIDGGILQEFIMLIRLLVYELLSYVDNYRTLIELQQQVFPIREQLFQNYENKKE